VIDSLKVTSPAPTLVRVPGGVFTMGSSQPDRFANGTEKPPQRIEIKSFYLAQFPVTENQWREFAMKSGGSELPVVNISWFEAVAFTEWLSDRTERAFRLPTEAEWEYACRAGSETIFSSGDMITINDANFLYDDRGARVGPGGRTKQGCYPANAFGLEDMHGNVCEWVADVWRPHYAMQAEDYDDAPRVIRGGAWDYLPRLLRSAWRDWAPPDMRRDNLGFRVACDLEP